MDQLYALYNSAVTISDYTSAQAEFISQNLDGTFKNTTIVSGAGYKAADVNRSGKLDGGDLVKLFAQAVNVNQLVVLPSGYASGSNGFMSLMTFKDSEFNSATPANWATLFPGNTQSVYTFTTPAAPGTPSTINIKYLIDGDINRSLSSTVVQNGATVAKQNIG